MADQKISALSASTTPLAGTEVLPIVQSGVTKQVSVANLTAGRAISATELTLSTGNLVIGTSGKGIDFSATPGTGTSELLADYEEGIWTPVVTSQLGSLTAYTSSGIYTKIGRTVSLAGIITITTAGTASGVMFIAGYPFANGSTTITQLGLANETDLTGTSYAVRIGPSATTGFISGLLSGGASWTTASSYSFSLTYSV